MTTTRSRKTEPKTAKASTQKLRIHFADGNKGGVGKSFLARTLYQYCLDRKLPILGVEADIDSPDFKGIYREAAVSRFSEDEILLNQANDIVNWSIGQQKNLVVNLPATVHKAFDLWLRNYNILDLAKTADVELVKWFVCTGEYDSMKSLGVSLKTFGETIPHIVVKNLKYSEWGFFDDDRDTQELIQQHHCPVITLPKLPVQIANTLLQQRLTFDAALKHQSKGFGIVQQSAVRGYLNQAYAAFESTGRLR
jgi:CobQ/CobB/MinD/ParA nucleotide binding domain